MQSGSFLTRLPTHDFRLANGLTVLVRVDRSAPVVAIVTHVKAGYFNEPDHLIGISHVLEHMYFKGTERRGMGELARDTKDAGGYLNAGTIYDYTSYYTVLPSSALEAGLDIQADALKHSEIDEDELRKELLVIIQESKRKLDNPAAVAVETLYEELFDVHRMRRWRIGTEAGLERLTREDVWGYYRDLYRASNIVLVVAGDVDPERTLALVQRHYGDLPPGQAVCEPSPDEPERRGFRFRECSGDIVQSYVEWGWRTPDSLHPDTPALDLLAVLIGQGRASRLYRGVREAGWATSIGAHNYTPTEIGVFGVGAQVLPADTRPALEATWAALDALRRDRAAPDELERARNIVEARLLRRTESVEGQARLLADWQALGDWRLAEQYVDRLLAASAADLQRVADGYLALDRATLLVYRPVAAPPLEQSADELAETLRAAAVSMHRGAAVTPDLEAAEPEHLGRVPGHAARAPSALTGAAAPTAIEDDVRCYELSNGVRLAVKPRPSSPLVSMAICFRGGPLHEPVGSAGITGLMARVSIKGTATRSAARLAEETEALGGAILPGISSDTFQWHLALPSRHFERGLELLADAALRPAFPEAELERERRLALSQLEQLRDDMYRYPVRLFLQSAFRDHPYGVATSALASSLHALTRDDLRRWHDRQAIRARPWVVVVGDVDPDAAARAVEREVEPVAGAEPHDGARPPTWPAGPHEEAEQRAKAQTALILGFPGSARNDPELYALDVLSKIVSGLGGRFFEELRERRSLAYTVAAYPLVRWLGGAFIAYIATSPEREDEARAALLEQFERLAEEAVAREELERAQRYAIGGWKIRSQTNTAQLGNLGDALLLGAGVAELREFEDRIRAVTPVQIREAAMRYFHPNRLVEGIVRGTGERR